MIPGGAADHDAERRHGTLPPTPWERVVLDESFFLDVIEPARRALASPEMNGFHEAMVQRTRGPFGAFAATVACELDDPSEELHQLIANMQSSAEVVVSALRFLDAAIAELPPPRCAAVREVLAALAIEEHVHILRDAGSASLDGVTRLMTLADTLRSISPGPDDGIDDPEIPLPPRLPGQR
ncbi:MAG: hypothetical protein KC731_05265 [Myxococcales bacterium]|nr:hypothetical protein [Myxococcales bacterium]